MKTRLILFILGPVGLAALLGGCTAIGTYVGWRSDKANAQREIRVNWQHPDSIPINYPVQVTLTNGKKLSALFMGEVYLPDSTYRERFAACDHRNSIPCLDSMLILTRPSGRQFRYPFAGFDEDALLVWNTDSQRKIEVACADLDTLADDRGNGYSPQKLDELIVSRQVPLRTAIRLRYDGAPFVVPLDDVAEINTGSLHSNNWIFGMVLGGITDALIAGAIIRSAQK